MKFIMELSQNDIETLDYMVKACHEKGFIQETDLELPESERNAPYGVDIYNWTSQRLRLYYREYFEILKEYDSIYDFLKVDVYDSYVEAESKDFKTKRFIQRGGFQRLHEELQQKGKLENVLKEKTLNDALLAKWAKNTYWISVVIVVLSFLISIAALIVAILKP